VPLKIVVVSARFPYPLDKGDRLTVFHLLREFSARHRMTLVCFLEPEQDPGWVEKVRPFCDRVEMVPLRRLRSYLNCATGIFGSTPLQLRYYHDPAMHDAVRRVVEEEKPDLLYSQLLRMAPYIEPHHQCARVAAFNLSLTLNHRRMMEHATSFFSRRLHRLEYNRLRPFEVDFARRFDRVLYISRHDMDAVDDGTPLDNVFINPHGVDHVYFAPDPTVERVPASLVMTGNMQYEPNIDAASFFCTEVLPLVRREIPEARVSIVGADPPRQLQALGDDPAIEVTGRVPDLRGYMHRAEVGVAPIRMGAGLQNKVLEGMSVGLPMVITSVANEGIQAEAGENVVIADSAADLAAQVVALLRDPDRRRELGEEARRFIEEKWTWETHHAKLEAMMEQLVAEKKASAE
jgi:sugar transferase (PEP-CTERM/EpsH1 system associated)